MTNVIVPNFAFAQYTKSAQDAVHLPPTQVTVWALAEYLDLVEARELPPNAALVRECSAVIKRFVMTNLENGAYVPFWERAGCLFRAYKRALKVAERAIDEQLAKQA